MNTTSSSFTIMFSCSQNPKQLEKKREYVVPLIKKVNWRLPSHRRGAADAGKETLVTKSEEELALDREAAAAIRKGIL